MDKIRFDEQMERVRRFRIENDRDQAVASADEAVELAEKMKWCDGVLIAELELSSIYATFNMADQQETTLLETRLVALNDSSCTSPMLQSVYSRLFFSDLVKRRDPDLSSKLLDEMLDLRPRFDDEGEYYKMLEFSFGQIRYSGLGTMFSAQEERYLRILKDRPKKE